MELIYNSGKIKALLILVACMSILLSISCVCAADIDNAIGDDQNSIDINALDEQESVEPVQTGIDANIDGSADVCDESGMADSNITPHHHHKNLENGSDAKIIKHMHRHTGNDTCLEKVGTDDDSLQCNREIHQNSAGEREILPGSINVNYCTPNGDCENAVNIAWIATENGIPLNFTDSFSNAMPHEHEMAEWGTCCCDDCKCGHNMHAHAHEHGEIIPDGAVNDDFMYSYNHFTQINKNRLVVIGLRDSGRQETEDLRNNNVKGLQNLNCSQGLIDEGNGLRDYGDIGGTMNCHLACNCTDSMHSGLSLALKIALNSDELDIKDYNMEYYIFTNPYIIMKNIGVEYIPLNNNIENHCFNSPKANKTIAPTVNYNHSLFNDCITPDNHGPNDLTSIFSADITGFGHVRGESAQTEYLTLEGKKDV